MKSLPSLLSCALLLVGLGPALAGAGEIGFRERFALAEDRAKALEELIPGTEEDYYYRSLQLQHTGRLEEVDRLLKLWVERHGRTAGVEEIENRQALLRYDSDPSATLKFLRERLGLGFGHQRRRLGETPDLPTKLDESVLEREALTRRALQLHRSTTEGFEPRALGWVAGLELDVERRRHLLDRLERPDVEGLVDLVVADLKSPRSRGFGSLRVHSRLLTEQLDECVRRLPELIDSGPFIQAYLVRLRPGADVDWHHDASAREAYLERLWGFVSRLSPAHNSLKAHVLYRRLVHDRAQGVYDRSRLELYLKLPRRAPYVSEEHLKRSEGRVRADLGADFRSLTRMPSVGSDEELVRDYLLHFFTEDESYRPYLRYVKEEYLKRVFAEAKILAGVGDMEEWASLLSPSEYRVLKERVDIDFAPTNKTYFEPGEQVALDVDLKGVETLIVKVFELNALNYYRATGREVDTSIDIDGLVAGHERTLKLTEPDLRRVRRHFEFPQLEARGVYVVEFIGGGKSSRALVRKGRLSYRERISTAGHVLTVVDEAGRKQPGASVYLGGHHYEAGADAAVTVPFTTQPARVPIVLVEGDFATLESLSHRSEEYRLEGGIHVEREALLERRTTRVVVRPTLTVCGVPVTLSVLEDVRLEISTTDLDGVESTKEVKDFELFEDRESTQEFQVPPRLAAVSFQLRARVKNLSQQKKVDLAVGRSFQLNGIDATEEHEALHLMHASGRWALELLGKTGEGREQRAVHVKLKHRDFRDVVEAVLQSGAGGRVELGELEEVEWVAARPEGGREQRWELEVSAQRYPAALQGRVGEALVVPYGPLWPRARREELSLLELRGGAYARDRFEALRLEGGALRLEGLGAGDYELYLKGPGERIAVRVAAGEEREGHASSGARRLELSSGDPLRIASVEAQEGELKVKLAGATKHTRVHVVATRYAPEYGLFESLDATSRTGLSLTQVVHPETHYVAGRDLGDEYRYILERQLAEKYAGNMLDRPSLILNPWAIRSTETDRQDAQAGGVYAAEPGAPPAAERQRGEAALLRAGGEAAGGFASLDFLAEPATMLLNLEPDEKGVVTVAREAIGPQHTVHIVAVDPEWTSYRQLALAEVEAPVEDLRLAAGLDPERHYAEQKEVSVHSSGEAFTLSDITTSEFEVYDRLERVYRLFATLSGDPTLAEFGFVLTWPQLERAEKLAKYSEYACHELNFFLLKKDPEFFESVIRPHLASKKDKTFLDRWLLGEDLLEYLEPWRYARLNALERILLGRRIAGEAPRAARHLQELLELSPPDLEHLDHLFRTALRSRALETVDEFGVEAAIETVTATNREQSRLPTLRRSRARGAAHPAAPGESAALEETEEMARKAATKQVLDRAKTAASSERFYFAADGARRLGVRQLFRKLEKTKEWAENNYYHQPIERQDASLVPVSAFWCDYARHDGRSPFLSPHLAQAARGFTEMMLALAVTDLPFEAGEHESSIEGTRFELEPSSPLVVFHQEIREAEVSAEAAPILVSQNFYRHGERYREVGGEKVDNYITDEFLIQVAYGCHVVVTNPTSSRQKLDVLLQIPRGAMPVLGGQYTRSLRVELEPYHTWTSDYFFYFPAAGDYAHYPVHVSRREEVVAWAPATTLHVVAKPSRIDRASWEYISQNGTEEEVITYLREHNLQRVKLARIAWRMRSRAFFEKVIALLRSRHVYDHTLWSYAIHHDALKPMQEYLRHCDAFVAKCGAVLQSKPLWIEPVERRTYQHLEYWPLVNARAHQLGSRRQILNNRFHEQYQSLMRVLCYRAQLSSEDLLAVTYYLLLQDRVGEALDFFAKVKPREVETKIQYDAFDAYLALSTENPRRAKAVATPYSEYPVERWRKYFATVLAQVEEIEGGEVKVVDEESRTQQQTQLAATEPSLELEVEAGRVTIRHQGIESCRVNYYRMDIELLFSNNPFVQGYSGRFAYVRPNRSDVVRLKDKEPEHSFELPEEFRSANVLVEVEGGGSKRSSAHFASSLDVQVVENYGHLRVSHEETKRPLPKVYVKVYARLKGGAVRFYKDGYTDLRGRFDYASLSTNEIDAVERLAILVLSEEHGATVREAAPPKQ